MTTVFLFCGLSTTLMFFLFFVVPNLDKLFGSTNAPERKSTPIRKVDPARKQTRASA